MNLVCSAQHLSLSSAVTQKTMRLLIRYIEHNNYVRLEKILTNSHNTFYFTREQRTVLQYYCDQYIANLRISLKQPKKIVYTKFIAALLLLACNMSSALCSLSHASGKMLPEWIDRNILSCTKTSLEGREKSSVVSHVGMILFEMWVAKKLVFYIHDIVQRLKDPDLYYQIHLSQMHVIKSLIDERTPESDVIF